LEDEADKALAALVEEDTPAVPAPAAAAAAAVLGAPAGLEGLAANLLNSGILDENFNAFTYDFFGGDGASQLLGELEPEGGLTRDEEVPLEEGEVADLSALADFEPLDPALLAPPTSAGAPLSTWGSMDPALGEAVAAPQGGAAAAPGAPAAAPAPAPAAGAGGEGLSSKLEGLSLGAGFD
jgi:hypothetical protein